MKLKSFTEFILESNEAKVRGPIKMVFVGDIIRHRDTTSTTEDPFVNIKNILDNSDIAVCSLESMLSNDESFTKFSTGHGFAKLLKSSGFTHVSISNNHVLDYGMAGMQETEDVLVEAGLKVLSNKDIININDYNIEIYNFTTHINNDGPSDIKNQLTDYTQYSDNTVDFNIAYVHWCNIQDNEINKLAKSLSSRGYEFVIGSGNHKVSDATVDGSNILVSSLGDLLGGKDTNGAILVIEVTEAEVTSAIKYHTELDEDGLVNVTHRNVLI